MKKISQVVHQWSWSVLLAFCIIGLFFPVIGAIALVCMAAPVVGAFFKGRRWCGAYCPRGSFNDIIISKFTMKRRIPALFKKNWFKLIFLTLLMGAFAVQLILTWGNIAAVGRVFVRMIVITTLFSIFLGIIFSQRTWCLICPMGTMAHYVAKMETIKNRIQHVTFNAKKCIHCKICSKSCPITIDVYGYRESGRVLDANCLKCMSCVDKCPRKSLYVA